MLKKYFRIFETIYLIVAILSVIEVFSYWNSDKERAYLFLFFAVISTFIFFFRRHYRRKFQKRQNQS